jgi:hypothetical protein
MIHAVQSLRSRWVVGFLALPLFFLAGYGIFCREQSTGRSASPEPIDVGMVALLATPEKYDGKSVRTIGFVCMEFEGKALYLHEEDYRHGLIKDSFALRLTDSQRREFKSMSPKYVLIEGRVYANGPEAHEWAGAIGNITRLEVWPADRGPVPHR